MAEVAKENTKPEVTSKPAVKETSAKEASFRCVTKCFWKGRLYNEGDTVTTRDTPPEHFVKL